MKLRGLLVVMCATVFSVAEDRNDSCQFEVNGGYYACTHDLNCNSRGDVLMNNVNVVILGCTGNLAEATLSQEEIDSYATFCWFTHQCTFTVRRKAIDCRQNNTYSHVQYNCSYSTQAKCEAVKSMCHTPHWTGPGGSPECNRNYMPYDNNLCVDINECLNSGLCQNGWCVNSPGNYYCECYQGYDTDSSNHSCVPDIQISTAEAATLGTTTSSTTAVGNLDTTTRVVVLNGTSPTAAIVGGAVGAVVLVILAVVLIVLWRKRLLRKKSNNNNIDHGGVSRDMPLVNIIASLSAAQMAAKASASEQNTPEGTQTVGSVSSITSMRATLKPVAKVIGIPQSETPQWSVNLKAKRSAAPNYELAGEVEDSLSELVSQDINQLHDSSGNYSVVPVNPKTAGMGAKCNEAPSDSTSQPSKPTETYYVVSKLRKSAKKEETTYDVIGKSRSLNMNLDSTYGHLGMTEDFDTNVYSYDHTKQAKGGDVMKNNVYATVRPPMTLDNVDGDYDTTNRVTNRRKDIVNSPYEFAN